MRKFRKFTDKYFSPFIKHNCSPDRKKFQDSRNGFRRKILIALRLSLTIFCILIMAVAFPFQEFSSVHYAVIPLFMIVNFLICTFLLKRPLGRFSSVYISFILFMMLSTTMELSLFIGNRFKEEKGIFIGIEIGLMYSMVLLSKMPAIHLFFGSLVFDSQVIIKLYSENVHKPMVTFIIINIILSLIIFLYFRDEAMEFKTWTSLQRSYEGLDRFRKLIDVLPIHLTLIDPISWQEDKLLYQNKEFERQRMIISDTEEEGGGLQDFLKRFFLEPNGDCLENLSLKGVSLESIVKSYVLRDRQVSRGSFDTYLASFKQKDTTINYENSELVNHISNKSLKFEVKIGWVNWGDSEAIILVLNDISNTDKIRELKSINDHKDQLLATVSHELRTPLNGIISMIDIMDEELEDRPSQIRYYISIARNSAKTLLFMINDILDISQIQKGKLRITVESTLLSATIQNVIPIIQVLANEKGLNFLYIRDFPEDIQVMVDPIRFQQIMMNLLSNACKFTAKGFVKMTVKLKKKHREWNSDLESCHLKNSNPIANLINFGYDDGAEAKIHISVEDSGIGIKPENLSRLFEVFGKFEHNNNKSGVGLGLAISQKLALCMGSKGIKVKSTYGQGSVFWFSVKACLLDPLSEKHNNIGATRDLINCSDIRNFSTLMKPKRSPQFNKIEVSHHTSRVKMLVVDDDLINHTVIQQYLKNFQTIISCDKAYNGAEAVSLIELNSTKNIFYDLILMDCDMPVMNGFQATEFILRKIEQKEILPLRIIAITANVLFSDKEKCFKAGMSDVWCKPINKKDFEDKIETFIRLSSKPETNIFNEKR